MRVPLSWLCDFAPFEGAPADLAATFDDLGLVVEGIEHVGEGLEDVVVARIDEIAGIEGADRIRRVVVDAGGGPLEIVCGAKNFSVGDLVPLAPVGAVLPGGFAITSRKMKGIVSNGMLCSGTELGLGDDEDGLLLLTKEEGAAPGRPLAEVLGIEPDVVFDLAVEANRPDAWCIAGVARDLAARMRLPFSVPEPPPPIAAAATGAEPVTVRVDAPDLAPRFTARVLTGVTVGPSPDWLARRLTLAGMRPINNVVDASNYVMLELGQPTHPYDLDRVPGRGLVVRRARHGETVTTLDRVDRRLGVPGPGIGDDGDDCLICDAAGEPLGIGGIMGGESSEIDDTTTTVLLEAAYFTPMAIARTSKRLALRTEASARFERGCDPRGIDRAADRFVELLALTAGPGCALACDPVDVAADVPEPLRLTLRTDRVNALLGTRFAPSDVGDLLRPLGFDVEPATGAARAAGGDGDGALAVVVPTFRPDIRPEPFGQADVIEEVARTFGYSRLPRRQPAWPQVGGLTAHQRGRRYVKDVLCGLGASEAWTTSFLSAEDHRLAGLGGPAVAIENPLVEEESVLRRSLLPGLLRALAYNADRRQGELRLFEVGTVFPFPSEGHGRQAARAGAGGAGDVWLPDERELVAVALAGPGDDAGHAVAAWWGLAESLRLAGVSLAAPETADAAPPGLHPTRSAWIVAVPPGGGGTVAPAGGDRGQGDAGGGGGTGAAGTPGSTAPLVLGAVGEVDPDVQAAFGVTGGDGRRRRVGWIEVDLGLLLDPAAVERQPEGARPVSRFPSSDIDLAFVVPEGVPAGAVAATLADAGGELLESVVLFDVFRGESLGADRRSLAYRLRFCALDRTLTDDEVGALRTRCIDAVADRHAAVLR